VDFGAVEVGTAITRGFTIRNTGLEPLVITSATLDGLDVADFALTVPPTATVAAGSSTTVEVTFTATPGFARSAVLRLVSNDPEAGLMEIQLAATVAGVLNVVYATGAEIPVNVAAFTATGSTVNLSLAHAPATGSQLTVVRNSGLGFISGEFSNLAQGQVVELGHAGQTYKFVANYYGGSGNDLVLHWAATRAFAWGLNTNGQLGTGTTTTSKLPLEVTTTGVLGGKTIFALAAGKSHSLALGPDGTLAAWGSNGYGQLGTGNNTASKVPVAVGTAGVLNGKRVVAVAAGSNHSLALCADGTLAAWGDNFGGMLGDGTTTTRNFPVAVDTTGVLAGKRVVAVAAGGSHNLALCDDGTLAAWGYNLYGQLGDGGTLVRSRPVAVSVTGALAGKTVVAIAAGAAHSLAICADGAVVAWGSNFSGQLGNGGTADSKLPVTVETAGVLNGRTVVAVAVGGSHSLAWSADGTLAAWGSNGGGQLGNGSQTQSNLPVAVDTSGVLVGKSLGGVSAGNNFSIARGADGTLATWGDNWNGQLGDNSTTRRLTPVAADTSALAPGWRLVAGVSGQGADHTLGLVALPFIPRVVVEQPVGTVLANGSGTVDFESGAVNAVTAKTFTIRNRGVEPLLLGEASISGPQAAEFVLTTPPAATVAPGDSTTLVVTFTAGAGFNRRADLRFPTNDPYAGEVHLSLTATGTGTLEAAYGSGGDVPLTVAGFQATGSTVNFVLNFVPVPGTALTVVRNTGAAFIQGVFSNLVQGGEMMLSHGGRSYRFVANYYGGSGNDLVLLWAAARPVAWGRNSSGQLGIGGSTQSNFPAAVDMTGVLAGKRMVAAAASRNHSLALCADGTLAGWGSNLNGELGTGTTASSQTPVAAGVGGALAGRTVVAIATGSFFSLALGADGMVAAWGSNSSGQLGNGGYTTSTVPVAVSTTGALAGKAVVAIAAGSAHCLALCADGTLAAWGSNADGQLGFGNYTDRNVPGLVYTAGVLAGKTVVAVAAGNSHSLALCADGTLVAWGSNAAGKLGTGTTSSSAMPVAVSTSGVLAGKTVVAMAAGERHSLALCADGTVAASGSNTSGELGNGTTASSSVPVAVVADGALAGKTPVALTAGFSHSLALCSDGTLVGWGYNFYGQLGNGSTTKSLVPMAVSRGSLLDGECIIAGTSGASAYHSLGLVASPPVRFAGYAISTPFQTAVTVSLAKLLAEAADSDGDSISVTAAGPASAQGGTAVLQDGGVVYTPPTGFSGADSFSVTLADAGGASVIGTVTVTVGPNPNSGGMGVNPPVLTVLPGGKMGLAFQGIPGRSYIVQRSVSGLDNWVTLATLVADASGKVAYTDESPPAGSAFYRLGLP
jgi:alpha-tubulin suppressor-like RCC1 family protein